MHPLPKSDNSFARAFSEPVMKKEESENLAAEIALKLDSVTTAMNQGMSWREKELPEVIQRTVQQAMANMIVPKSGPSTAIPAKPLTNVPLPATVSNEGSSYKPGSIATGPPMTGICFMCRKPGHLMGKCPSFLDFIAKGWIVPESPGSN